jgi:hypothetical protein
VTNVKPAFLPIAATRVNCGVSSWPGGCAARRHASGWSPSLSISSQVQAHLAVPFRPARARAAQARRSRRIGGPPRRAATRTG